MRFYMLTRAYLVMYFVKSTRLCADIRAQCSCALSGKRQARAADPLRRLPAPRTRSNGFALLKTD